MINLPELHTHDEVDVHLHGRVTLIYDDARIPGSMKRSTEITLSDGHYNLGIHIDTELVRDIKIIRKPLEQGSIYPGEQLYDAPPGTAVMSVTNNWIWVREPINGSNWARIMWHVNPSGESSGEATATTRPILTTGEGYQVLRVGTGHKEERNRTDGL